MSKIAFTIAVEPPPSNLPPEATEYLNRMFLQFAAALLEAETQLKKIDDRVTTLESAP